MRRVVLAAVVLVLAGCGSEEDPRTFPPAAEPARSPVPTERPEGEVVKVGNKPEGLVVDPRTGLVAVALTDPDELALVDARTLKVRKRVPLPGAPRHLRLAKPGGPVLVPAESGDRLVEVSLPRGRTTTTPVGDGPHDADATPDGRVYVADEFGSTLTVVEDGRRVAQVPAPLQPGGIAAVADGPIALVAVRERVVALFDPRTARRLDQAVAGVGPTHVETGAGGRVYVADTDGDAILLFQTRPELKLVRRAQVEGEPYAMTMDRKRNLWVTQTALNRVVRLTADGRPRPKASFPTVRQPNSVAVDPRTGRVFVASRTDGTLQAFDPPKR